jgi:predicted amidohydrolase YtcJ
VAVSLVIVLTHVNLTRATTPASAVFVNGRVLKMDPANQMAQALAIKGARIVAAGSNADIMRQVGRGTRIYDLSGKTLMPGFIDAHGHFPQSEQPGVYLNSPPLGRIRNIEDLVSALKAAAPSVPPGKLVYGWGYDDTLLAERRQPTRQDLDRVSLDQPVFILNLSAHSGVANSRALAMVGIDANTPSPPGGVIVKDQNTGQPTGLLQETAMWRLAGIAADVSDAQYAMMVEKAAKAYAQVGVTMAQAGWIDEPEFRRLVMVSHRGTVPIRLIVWPFFNTLGPKFLSGELKAKQFDTDRFRVGAIKLAADGSIQGYTGYLSKPYYTPFHGDADYRGFPAMPRDELTHWVTQYHCAGFQIAIHANGDAAIDDVIFAFGQAQARCHRDDPRMILVHAQMARDDQLDAMKALGITPSFFSSHTYYWGDRHRDIFMGPERAARMSPTHSALERGLRFTVHSDTPVTPMNPLMLVWCTVNRLSTSGKHIGADQRISIIQALRAVTIDAAWQAFREHDLGSIEPGKYADLVVLDGDVLDPEKLDKVIVDSTWVGGVKVFERAPTPPAAKTAEDNGGLIK